MTPDAFNLLYFLARAGRVRWLPQVRGFVAEAGDVLVMPRRVVDELVSEGYADVHADLYGIEYRLSARGEGEVAKFRNINSARFHRSRQDAQDKVGEG